MMKIEDNKVCIRAKVLNVLLFVSFVLTIMVPLTGIQVHKLASTLFLLLCIVHTIMYRKKLGMKMVLVLAAIFISFLSGIFGMVLEEYVIFLQLHKTISIVIVFFLAIHIFIYRKRFGVSYGDAK